MFTDRLLLCRAGDGLYVYDVYASVCAVPSSSSPKSNSSRYGVQRSETSIKQMLLDWCRSKVKDYRVSWFSLFIRDAYSG